MAGLSNRGMLTIGLVLVVGIGIIFLVIWPTLQNSSNNNNPLTASGAKKTVFLHQKPEANVMWNETGHSYFDMQGKVFKCNSFFDGSIYYNTNDTNYFKCIDRGSTQGEDTQYQIVP